MTDAQLKEKDACPRSGLGFWQCHAAQPTALNKPRCHQGPDSLLQDVAANSLPLLSGKHWDRVTGEASENLGRQVLFVSLAGHKTCKLLSFARKH